MKNETNEKPITNLSPYDQPHLGKSVWQIVNTLVPFVLSWYAAYESLAISFWLSLPFSILAAALTVRTFIIFHDCCHRSFFKNRLANQIVGYITGVLTLTPYEQWRYTHVVHHATSGNLDKRGVGDIWTMTLKEYVEASRWKKFYYRLYRHPIVMYTAGPIFVFLMDYRFNRSGASWKERINLYLTNLGIVASVYGMCEAIGWQAFLMIQLPVFMISSILGIWMFYVQHQFEDSYYATNENWDFVDAALKGSSFFKLPAVLNWLTGNIGFHHVHHLNPRVPNYNLIEVHYSNKQLQQVPVITLSSSFATMRLVLWDEDNKIMIGWKELRKSINKSKIRNLPTKKVS